MLLHSHSLHCDVGEGGERDGLRFFRAEVRRHVGWGLQEQNWMDYCDDVGRVERIPGFAMDIRAMGEISRCVETRFRSDVKSLM